ncbi:hypothetical protein EJC49_23470 [Aquibium carbonis]|uniref:Uncharacterized protein n=1 Tax=Aquibium carbonis TaxID=2495581 RepID=A0A429YM07_9HYPH|nr:hypothetical protein [Aquibium carbonis]RST82454.1 hypothetical protein EJC49_23470 [Aquibium carbonis]
MAEATNDLLYERMKSIHPRMDRLDAGLSKGKQENTPVRLSMMGMQTDIHDIYGMLACHDERFDRIERRLDLREFAEPQRPIQP